ncbi:citryl-CoA lyase [Roseibaca sp. Y0-43]|uniref:citryl-CoA lyase n=1 Tax=Roseibaca sp. Y0-43 TaxID=2816854 RepID=UPI001D0C2DD7|nr:citryl-CoA lyase [Roseibaca sp. Y0-43]MCC1482293.1 citryl-CoA lyase [Roseibaca sp. Y0-43]
MMIGKATAARSSICDADASSIRVHGHSLTEDLMGVKTFTDFFFLSVTGQMPTNQQRYFLDVLLISIAEHGLTPNAQAARMTLAAGPDALQGALAAGILGCGTVILGAAEDCGKLLTEAKARCDEGTPRAEAARALVAEAAAEKRHLPGFGHPLHKPEDPRTTRILSLTKERGVAGAHCAMAEELAAAVTEARGKPLTMNVSMAIAAVLLDLDFPATMIKGVPLLARAAGLLGHLAEEQKHPIGFLLAGKAAEAIEYVPEGADT